MMTEDPHFDKNKKNKGSRALSCPKPEELRTREDFDRFLEAAEELSDSGIKRQPDRDGRLIEEVMNFRYTF